LLGRGGHLVARLGGVAKYCHSHHGRSRNKKRSAGDPGNMNALARGNTFGGQLRKDMFAVISHIGIFVHLVALDADGRCLPTLSGPGEIS
jgi:hypothetical protein